MKDFNIESIERKMPYKEPSEEYFSELENNILSSVKSLSQPPKRTPKMRYIFMATAVAASLFVGVFMIFDKEFNAPRPEIAKLVTNDINESVDLYLENLSDADIETLASEASDQDIFYSLLP